MVESWVEEWGDSMKKRILVIEDGIELQQVYTEVLGEEFDIDLAATGKTGLEKAAANLPDLIVLDIMLPEGMNGFDVLEELKRNQKFKKIPVIVMTNLDSEKETALKIGADDYIVKANISMQQLEDRIHALLGQTP